MRQRRFSSLGPDGFHPIAYTDWGDEDAGQTLVCVHGLTRNSRDFDVFADAMQDAYRVVCPDLVGRGDSGWLSDPVHYGLETLNGDLDALLERLGPGPVDWVGTSLGGLLGMIAASQAPSSIRRLVMVDIGPYIPLAALLRIRGYIGGDPRFDTLQEVEDFYRLAGASFGPLTDDNWRHLAHHGTRDDGAGRLRLHYDPRIAQGFSKGLRTRINFWPHWEQVTCPVLVVRGEQSDLLSAETVGDMKRRGPAPVDEIVVPETGHAPLLMDGPSIKPVRNWLLDR